MLVPIFILILSVLYILYLRTSNKKYREKLSKIKSDPALPILGHAFSLGRTKEDMIPALERMWRKFGCDKFILKIGPIDQVVLTKPSDIEVILSSNEHVNKNIYYKNLRDIAGDSVILTDAHRWRPLRKMWAPAFNYKYLEAYVDILNDEISDLMKKFNENLDKELNVFPLINKSVLTATCKIALGCDANTNLGNYVNNMQSVLDITGSKIFSTWKSIDLLFDLTEEGKCFKKCLKIMNDYSENAINLKRNELKSVMEDIKSGRVNIETYMKQDKFNTKEFNFLSHILLTNTNSEFLNNEDIRTELVTFIFAGNETTSTTSSFAAYCLANNPRIQETAYQEQLSICGGDINKPITFKDLNEMKYLECVIKETMRLYPPIPLFGRRLTEDITLPGGEELPAECNILIMPFLTHKRPDVFPEAHIFDPERFLFDHPSQYSYFPFSAGPRNCVGGKLGLIESKFYLASILRAFQLLPPLEHPKLIMDLSLKSSTGINIRLKKRC